MPSSRKNLHYAKPAIFAQLARLAGAFNPAARGPVFVVRASGRVIHPRALAATLLLKAL
jgi:hypothetical protein